MLFYFTTLNFARVLYEDAPMLKEDETNKQVQVVVEAWNHSDLLWKSYILNSLDNTLYSVYNLIRIAKEPWDSLEKKIQEKECWLEEIWSQQIFGIQNDRLQGSYESSPRTTTHFAWDTCRKDGVEWVFPSYNYNRKNYHHLGKTIEFLTRR